MDSTPSPSSPSSSAFDLVSRALGRYIPHGEEEVRHEHAPPAPFDARDVENRPALADVLALDPVVGPHEPGDTMPDKGTPERLGINLPERPGRYVHVDGGGTAI